MPKMTVSVMRATICKIAAAISLLFLCAPATALAEPMPGGASSIKESFGDWQVGCVASSSGKICVASQFQVDPKTRQRVLAMELRVLDSGKFAGILLMPFGLALGKGVALQIDEQNAAPELAFSTCLPAGCLVPLELNAALAARLRAGKTVTLTATANDDDKPVSFAVSLNGFSAAIDRLKGFAE